MHHLDTFQSDHAVKLLHCCCAVIGRQKTSSSLEVSNLLGAMKPLWVASGQKTSFEMEGRASRWILWQGSSQTCQVAEYRRKANLAKHMNVER